MLNKIQWYPVRKYYDSILHWIKKKEFIEIRKEIFENCQIFFLHQVEATAYRVRE